MGRDDDPKPLPDEVESIMRELGAGRWAGRTMAEWEAHDAEVRAAKDRTEGFAAPRMEWAQLGWPARALAEAKGAARREAIGKLTRWNHEKRCVAILTGAKGCGKTVATVVWATRMFERGVRTRFARSHDLSTLSRYDAKAKAMLRDSEALVIDDVGTEYIDAAGSFMSDFDSLIDYFYSAMRPLVMSTNLTVEQFNVRYGERIADRVLECAVFIEIGEPSMRGAADIIPIRPTRKP